MTTLTDVSAALRGLYPYACALTKNQDDADDLIQDTFVRAATFLHKFDTGVLGAWLNTMMYRLFLSSRRSGAGSQGKYTYMRREISIETLRGFDVPVESTAEFDWDAARTLEMLQELTPDHCHVLELALDGASYEQISRATGCRLGTVKSRLKRARDELRAKLAA